MKIIKLVGAFPKLAMATAALAVLGSGAALASIGIGGNIFGGGDSVNLQSGLIGHWKMDESYTEWFEGFENGDLSDWTVHDAAFEIKTDNVYEGTNSVGIQNNSAPENVAETIPEGFEGGHKPASFSFYWYEIVNSSGGGLRLLDAAGNPVAAFASDNDQWQLEDGDGWLQVKGSTETYEVWNHVEFEFDWSNGTYDYRIERLSDGFTVTGTRNLASTTGIETLLVSEHHAQVWGGHGAMHMWFDDIKFTSLVAKDSTPHGNDGKVEGATPAQDRFDNDGSAHEFDGVSDLVEVAHSSSLDTVMGSSNKTFTLSAWAKPKAWENYSTIFNKATGGSWSNTTVGLWAYASGFRCVVGSNVSGNPSGSSVGIVHAPSLNEWHNIVCTGDGSTLRMYVDGVLVGSASIPETVDPTSNSSPLTIGRRSPTINESFPGDMDGLRIYNRDLNENEVSALHEAQHPPSEIRVSDLQKDLVGHWGMDGNAKDSTPHRNHGTVNGATPAPDRHGQSDSALTLDGTDDDISIGHSINWENQDYTTNLWFKLDSLTALGDSPDKFRIFYGSASSDFLDVDLSGSNFNFIGEVTTNNEFWTLGDSGVAKDTEWHLLTVTFTNGAVSGYIDGNHFNTVDTSGLTTQAINVSFLGRGNVGIGCCGPSYGDYWLGSFDDFRIYERVLSGDEVKQLYDSYRPVVQMSDLQKGLIGHWNMNGHPKDLTPYRNHGSLVNGPALTADRHGRANSAYDFDGSSSYITAPNQSIATRTGTYSLSMWFEPTVSGDQSLWQNSGGCSDRNGMQTSGTDWVSFGYYDGASYTRASGPINSGQWNHVTGVNNGGTLTIYVNGVQYGGSSGGYIHCSTDFMYLGRVSATGGSERFFDGKIDDVRLYDRVLSDTEVKTLHETYR